MSAQSDTQNVKVGVEQGGNRGFVKSGAEFDVESGGSLKLAGVAITASAAELNKSVLSARLVDVTAATLAVTSAAHDGKLILLDLLAGVTATLPAATGSGSRFKFLVKLVPTSNQHKVQVANSSDIIQGTILMLSDNTAAVLGYSAGAADDTISLNGTTTGGLKKGDWIELIDAAANLWLATGIVTGSGTEATPYSSAV
jgi:hypothetical protein